MLVQVTQDMKKEADLNINCMCRLFQWHIFKESKMKLHYKDTHLGAKGMIENRRILENFRALQRQVTV